MGELEVVAVGPVDGGAMREAAERAGAALGLPVRPSAGLPVPEAAWDPRRKQHGAPELLRAVWDARDRRAARILGVTEVDLFIPMLTFVFGVAQLSGEAAVISLARLRPEFHGLPPDPARLAERAAREALHELGHTCGLTHCPQTRCAMSLSLTVRQVDVKAGGYCAGCASQLDDTLPLIRAGRPLSRAAEAP